MPSNYIWKTWEKNSHECARKTIEGPPFQSQFFALSTPLLWTRLDSVSVSEKLCIFIVAKKGPLAWPPSWIEAQCLKITQKVLSYDTAREISNLTISTCPFWQTIITYLASLAMLECVTFLGNFYTLWMNWGDSLLKFINRLVHSTLPKGKSGFFSSVLIRFAFCFLVSKTRARLEQ